MKAVSGASCFDEEPGCAPGWLNSGPCIWRTTAAGARHSRVQSVGADEGIHHRTQMLVCFEQRERHRLWIVEFSERLPR